MAETPKTRKPDFTNEFLIRALPERNGAVTH